MLMSSHSDCSGSEDSESPDDQQKGSLHIERVKAAFRRQAAVLVGGCCLGLAGGIAYTVAAVPLYTASARVLIDDSSVRAVADLAAVGNFGAQDSSIDSQVELLRSEQIGLAVIDRLGLADGHQNSPPEPSLLDKLRRVKDFRTWFVPPEAADPPASSRLAALRRLQQNMYVRRVSRTYVLSIEYTSADRGEAARVANGIADAYLQDQLESKYESTRRAGSWLRERIAELRKQSHEADLAVERFRSDNNLLAAGGRLITEQQSSEINSQLIIARADTARARARFERIKSIIDTGDTGALVTEALEQPIFNELRSKYLDRSKRVSDLVERLDPGHVQVVNLRNEMRDYERLIFEELGRIAESYRSDYEVAKSREKSLDESLSGALGITAEANDALVTLRELERQAETYRTLHRNFLSRFEETTQKQSFPITEARIITRASVPEKPSHPRTTRALIFSLLLGAVGGAGIGVLREKSDRVFRTGAQVRGDLGAEFLGMLPIIKTEQLPSNSAEDAALLEQREFRSPPIMRFAVEKPLSGYAETLRAMKVAADISLNAGEPRVIGVVSMLPREGKSTTAKNFATLLALQGARTLLIDADLRNPGLTHALSPHSNAGVIEALLGGVALSELWLREKDGHLFFLPAVVKTRISHTADLLASPAMKGLLQEAGRTFDYVVVDLPPTGPIVDVRAAAELFSGFVFVVEWGKTARDAVRTTFRTEHRIRERCLGVVLNKVNDEKLGLYESYGSKDYYYRHYSAYYRS